MKTTRIILAGGFLGAGKTTLLWNAAQSLLKQGLRVGLITNDQAPELVDSALLSLQNLKVAEVSGSCFCCNFNGFTDAIQRIQADAAANGNVSPNATPEKQVDVEINDNHPSDAAWEQIDSPIDIIIAEPVGSCTDLSATIIQPLKRYWNTQITVSPLSVLADPSRLTAILDGGNSDLHADAAYIYRKQLEESDIILINKADQLSEEVLKTLKQRVATTYPSATVFTISALSGEGVDDWLNVVTTSNEAGKRIVDVDYDIYANGEAVLGWLNGTIRLQGVSTDWDVFVRTFLNELAQKFDANNHAIGHVKVIAENGSRYIVGNLTGTGQTLSLRSSAGIDDSIKFIINARVETSPEELDKIVRETLYALIKDKYQTELIAWKYLQPGRPEPTHRFSEVI
jgi:Ni2+-binding GTPase involved in maturation of urease and hydrogenase